MTLEQHQAEVAAQAPGETSVSKALQEAVAHAAMTFGPAAVGASVILIGLRGSRGRGVDQSMEPRDTAASDLGADGPSVPEAVLLDEGLLHRLAEEKRESDTSAGELLREGLELVLNRRAGLRGVAEWEEEQGALTDDELEKAAAQLFGGGSEKAA